MRRLTFVAKQVGYLLFVVVLFPGPLSSMANGLGDVVLCSLVFLIKDKVIFQAKFRRKEGVVFWL